MSHEAGEVLLQFRATWWIVLVQRETSTRPGQDATRPLSQFTNSARLRVMDKVIYTEREMELIDPKPGTKAAAARDFGIDLSLTVSNLRLTPEERIKKLDRFQASMKEIRKAFLSSTRHGRNRKGVETSGGVPG